MVNDRALRLLVFTAKFAASTHCFFLQSTDRRISVHIDAFIEHTHTHQHSFTPRRTNTFPNARAHAHKHRPKNTALSLIKPGHLLESPVTADGCCLSRLAQASQKPPSVIQRHINLLKSQPFLKGRHHGNLSAVVQGNNISLSKIHSSVTSALDDMRSEGGASVFSLPCVYSSFSPLISCLWVLSLKAILCLCLSFHICMNTVAFQSTHWVAPQPGLAHRSTWSGID